MEGKYLVLGWPSEQQFALRLDGSYRTGCPGKLNLCNTFIECSCQFQFIMETFCF